MHLEDLRLEIDRIDQEMMALFKLRMHISKEIGWIKKKEGRPIYDPQREEQLMHQRRLTFNDEHLYPYYETLLLTMLKLSKEYQNER